MKALTLGFLLVCAAAARADDTVNPDLTPEYYDTETAAAVAGIQMSYDRSNAYEYAGVIVRATNGKFRVSRPDTDYHGDGVSIDYDNDYAGYDTVADYHTHPCLPYSHWPAVFSDRDTNSNDNQALDGYMGDLCSGVVRRYVPGVTKRDMCWEVPAVVAAMAAREGVNICGAHGEAVGEIRITKLPIMQEIPGPKTLERGLNCW